MKIVESASPTRPLWHADRSTALAIAGFAGFCIITILVQARLLAGVDLAAAETKQAFVSGVLDAFGAVVGIAVSGELSVVYGSIGAIFLWRAGLDRWSLAPLAFVILVPLEIALKFLIHQPGVPSEFYRGVYYPLATVTLQGTFPSGHALRAGFLCAFPAIVLARQRGTIGWLAPLGFGALAVLMGLSRVYLGDHWLSDVVAGLLLGVAMALLVAPPVARRLATRIPPATSAGSRDRGPRPATDRGRA